MSIDQFSMLFYYLTNVIFIVANSYIIHQWLIHPTQRRRFRVCKPQFAIGWILFTATLVISVATPLRFRYSTYRNVSMFLIFMTSALLTLTAAIRLLRANAAERRAVRLPTAAQPPDGQVWPPPPTIPVREGGQSAAKPSDSGDFSR